MRRLLTLMTLALSLFSTGQALADPPPNPHHLWRNTNYPSHYVLYDAASRQWIETVDCRVLWRCNLVRNELNAIELNDPSRKMTIRLTYDQMLLKPAGAAGFSAYQNGTFDARERFSHYDAAGNYTGQIVRGHACKFSEYFAGQSSPAYTFVIASSSAAAVEIWDESRHMMVKLDSNRMYMSANGASYSFFKNGRW